jgi:enterochelin esterase-like enzyme
MFANAPTNTHRIHTITCWIAAECADLSISKPEKHVSWNPMRYFRKTPIGSMAGAADQVAADDSPANNIHSPATAPSSAVAAKSQVTEQTKQRCLKTRSWRRRVLHRRGVRIQAAMGMAAQRCSLAMLDEDGIVVFWHGRANEDDGGVRRAIDRHVSQFYIPHDVAVGQPLIDLQASIVRGSHIRLVRRLLPDGSSFWSTTQID